MSGHNGRLVAFLMTCLSVAVYSVASYCMTACLAGVPNAQFLAMTVTAVMMVLAIVAHNIKFEGLIHYLLAILFNSVAAGAAASVYTLALGLSYSIGTVLLVAGAVLACAAVKAVVAYRTDGHNLGEILTAVFTFLIWLGVLITLIVLWVNNPIENTLPAASCFLWVWFGFMIVGSVVTRDEDGAEAVHGFSFWSFGGALAVLGVAAIALLIAGGGDGCDCDCDGECGDDCQCPCHCDDEEVEVEVVPAEEAPVAEEQDFA